MSEGEEQQQKSNLKMANKRHRVASNKLVRALGEFIDSREEVRSLLPAAEEEEEAEKVEVKAPPKKVAKKEEPFKCAGNVASGDDCATPDAPENKRKSRYDKKLHRTCKACAKAIKATVKAAADE